VHAYHPAVVFRALGTVTWTAGALKSSSHRVVTLDLEVSVGVLDDSLVCEMQGLTREQARDQRGR
jgi:hypothetical protein